MTGTQYEVLHERNIHKRDTVKTAFQCFEQYLQLLIKGKTNKKTKILTYKLVSQQ